MRVVVGNYIVAICIWLLNVFSFTTKQPQTNANFMRVLRMKGNTLHFLPFLKVNVRIEKKIHYSASLFFPLRIGNVRETVDNPFLLPRLYYWSSEHIFILRENYTVVINTYLFYRLHCDTFYSISIPTNMATAKYLTIRVFEGLCYHKRNTIHKTKS